MPEGGQSAAQWLKAESPPKPGTVRLAASLLVATAVLGIIFVAVNWFLRGHAFAWSSLPGLLIATLNVFVAGKLLQLRYWALMVARILALWLAAGYITLFLSGRFAESLPALTLARLASTIITAALAITLFMPSVRKAFRAPNQPESA